MLDQRLQKATPIVEPLGEMELWVYDIEVEGTHTFFANDILVHNSAHFTLKALLDKHNLTQGKTPIQINDMITSIVNDRMTPYINAATDRLSANRNTAENRLRFKLEGIAQSAVYVAKKRYTQYLISSEGVKFAKPKLKVMGLDAARSQTSNQMRDKMKEAYTEILLLKEEDIQGYIEETRQWFFQQPLHVIARNTSANGLKKWYYEPTLYRKGCPGHVRAALLHNKLINVKGCQEDVEPIISGEKVKTVYLVKQNPTGESSIAFVSTLPKQFGLDRFVDKELQFEKTFLKPISDMLHVVGWKPEAKATLFDMF